MNSDFRAGFEKAAGLGRLALLGGLGLAGAAAIDPDVKKELKGAGRSAYYGGVNAARSAWGGLEGAGRGLARATNTGVSKAKRAIFGGKKGE